MIRQQSEAKLKPSPSNPNSPKYPKKKKISIFFFFFFQGKVLIHPAVLRSGQQGSPAAKRNEMKMAQYSSPLTIYQYLLFEKQMLATFIKSVIRVQKDTNCMYYTQYELKIICFSLAPL